VNFGTLTRTEENQKNREIQRMEQELAEVELYIQSDVGSQVDAMRQKRAGKDKQFQSFNVLKEQRDVKVNEIKEFQRQRTELQASKDVMNDELAGKISSRNGLARRFDENSQLWNSLTRDIANLEAQLKSAKNQAEVEKRNKIEDDRKEQQNETDRKRREAAEEKRAVEEAKKQARRDEMEARKQAAIEAHKRAKAQYGGSTGPGPGHWGFSSGTKRAATVSSEEVEPVVAGRFAEEKQICRQLVTLCQSLKPAENAQGGGKKKKRRRKNKKVTFTTHQFTHFSQIGVSPPAKTNALDETIKALEAKIEEYDNMPEEEAEETPVAETEEVPEETVDTEEQQTEI